MQSGIDVKSSQFEKKRNLKISKKNAKKRTIIWGSADHSEEQKSKARRKSSNAKDH